MKKPQIYWRRLCRTRRRRGGCEVGCVASSGRGQSALSKTPESTASIAYRIIASEMAAFRAACSGVRGSVGASPIGVRLRIVRLHLGQRLIQMHSNREKNECKIHVLWGIYEFNRRVALHCFFPYLLRLRCVTASCAILLCVGTAHPGTDSCHAVSWLLAFRQETDFPQ